MASKLAVQMFTLREFTKTKADFADSLQKVKAMGYPAVQLSAVGCMNGDDPEVSGPEARQMLDDNGLACVATHRGWPAILKNPQAEIDLHHALGCDFMAIGGLPGEYFADVAGLQTFLAEAGDVVPTLKEAGIRFGYHNHAHEFVKIGPNGECWIDMLIAEGAGLVNMEYDVYWVAHAGANPATYMTAASGRVPVIHFKDKEVARLEDSGRPEPVMCPVGEGNLDWDGLIPVCEESGVEWYCIEQDVCRRDPFDCLKSSFDFLTAKGL